MGMVNMQVKKSKIKYAIHAVGINLNTFYEYDNLFFAAVHSVFLFEDTLFSRYLDIVSLFQCELTILYRKFIFKHWVIVSAPVLKPVGLSAL